MPGIPRLRHRRSRETAGDGSTGAAPTSPVPSIDQETKPAGPPIVLLDLARPVPPVPVIPSRFNGPRRPAPPPPIHVTEDEEAVFERLFPTSTHLPEIVAAAVESADYRESAEVAESSEFTESAESSELPEAGAWVNQGSTVKLPESDEAVEAAVVEARLPELAEPVVADEPDGREPEAEEAVSLVIGTSPVEGVSLDESRFHGEEAAAPELPAPSAEEIAGKLGVPGVPVALAPAIGEMPEAATRESLPAEAASNQSPVINRQSAGSTDSTLDTQLSSLTAPAKRSLMGAALVIGHVLLLNALNLPLMVFMAQRLGNLGMGQWGAAVELATLASLLTTLGLRPLFVKTVAQKPDSAADELAYQLGLRGLLTLVACSLAISIAFALGYPKVVLVCVAISAGNMALTTLAMTLADLLQGLDRIKTYSAINFASGLALIAASGTALYFSPTPVSIAMAYTTGPAVGLLLYLVVAARYTRVRVRFSFRKFRELLRDSRTIAAYQISVAVRDRLERVLLPKLSGLGTFGFYYMGIMPADRLFVVPEGFVTAFFPAISRSHHKDPKSASQHVLHMMVTSLVACAPLAILVTFLAEPVARLLFKDDPTLCRDVIMITIWAVPLRGLQLPMGSALQASGRHATAAKSGMLATAVSLALTIGLIVAMGIRGACWAWVGRSAISALFLMPAFLKAFPGVYSRVPFMRIALGMGLMGGLLWGSTQVHLGLGYWGGLAAAACAATLIYFLAMIATRVIDMTDVKLMMGRNDP